MPVTMKDIAEYTGYSLQTVGFALGKQADRLRPETCARIREAAQKLGYQPNRLGRALVTGKTQLIGIYLPVLHTPFYATVAHHLLGQCQADQYEPLFRQHTISPMPPDARKQVWHVDGIISVHLPYQGMVGNRMVLIWNPTEQIGTNKIVPEKFACDIVEVTLFPAAVEAFHAFIRSGRQRIAFVKAFADDYVEERILAYRETMQDAGKPLRFIASPNQSRAAAREVIREYFRTCDPAERPDALFCHNDDMAIAAYRALCDLGISVPDDVAVIGCDGIEDGEYLPCQLSTIQQPIEQMCQQAWQFMRQRLTQPDSPQQCITLNAELLLRGTQPSCSHG